MRYIAMFKDRQSYEAFVAAGGTTPHNASKPSETEPMIVVDEANKLLAEQHGALVEEDVVHHLCTTSNQPREAQRDSDYTAAGRRVSNRLGKNIRKISPDLLDLMIKREVEDPSEPEVVASSADSTNITLPNDK
jgi:hypothetical protein